MRGGLLSVLASAFRLRQAVLSSTDDVTEGTARHGLNDHHDIGRERHVHLLRRGVDELFSADYLGVRGLDPREAAEHNELVTQAFDAVLVRWDHVAVVTNVVPEHLASEDLLMLATGLSLELPLRVAAYEARYGYLHSFLDEAATWVREPKVKAWWKSMVDRARRPILVSKLYSNGELDSHTMRDLRDGKTSPREGTLRVLARRLAELAVRDRRDERDAHPAELEFELRVAAAVADQRQLLKRLVTPRADDALIVQLHLFRDVLRDAPDALTEDLLRGGTHSASWPRVEERLRRILLLQMRNDAYRMEREADRRALDMDRDPTKGVLALAAIYQAQRSHLRSIDQRPGADGPDKRLAEHFEGWCKILHVAAGHHDEPLAGPRPELQLEMKADALCMEAIAPWLELSDEEREHRLREAVRICEGLAYAQRCLGHHLHKVGKIAEAIVHLRRSVELNPANEEGREELALIHTERGDHQDVIGLTAGPITSTTLRALRAHALLNAGDGIGAEELARGVLEEHPRQPLALRVLSVCLRASGHEREAQTREGQARYFERGVRSR